MASREHILDKIYAEIGSFVDEKKKKKKICLEMKLAKELRGSVIVANTMTSISFERSLSQPCRAQPSNRDEFTCTATTTITTTTFRTSETNTKSIAIRRRFNAIFHCLYRSKRSQIIVLFLFFQFFFSLLYLLPLLLLLLRMQRETNEKKNGRNKFHAVQKISSSCDCVCVGRKETEIAFRIEIYFIS